VAKLVVSELARDRDEGLRENGRQPGTDSFAADELARDRDGRLVDDRDGLGAGNPAL
jgi:hypothetical protein